MSNAVGFIGDESSKISFAKYSVDTRRNAGGKYNKYGWNVDVNIEWAKLFLEIWKSEYLLLTGIEFWFDEYDVQLSSKIYGLCHSLARCYGVTSPIKSKHRSIELIRTYYNKREAYMEFSLDGLCEYACFFDDFILTIKLTEMTNKKGYPYFIDLPHFEKIYKHTYYKDLLTEYYSQCIYYTGLEELLLTHQHSGEYKYLSKYIPPANINFPDFMQEVPWVVLHGVADATMTESLSKILSVKVPDDFNDVSVKLPDENNMSKWKDERISEYFKKFKENVKNSEGIK